VVTVTDWHPDQATATATPLSGSLVQTGWGKSSVILSPDGKEVYADDRLRGTYPWAGDDNGPDQSATISVDTLVAESVPDPEEQLEGSDNPLIDVGSDYNFWAAMTLR
jgi:hypothetical protein